MPMLISMLDSSRADFRDRLDRLLAYEPGADAAIEQTVATIVSDVRRRGDAAVLEYTRRFDRLQIESARRC